MSKLQVWTWNVNGIRAVLNRNRIQEFLETAKPHILCVQETKIDEEKTIEFSLKDKFPEQYYQYWNGCKPPIRGYAGTVVFSLVRPLQVTYDIGLSKHDREGRTITLEFDKFFVVGVYVPNCGAQLKWQEYRVNEWDCDFRDYLKSLELKGKPVIVAGDLNVAHKEIDIFDPSKFDQVACYTQLERDSFSKLVGSGFVDSFRYLYPTQVKYSFWDLKGTARKEKKGWRLDYVLCSEMLCSEHNLLDSEIHNEQWGSDHCPVSATFDCENIDIPKFQQLMSKYKSANDIDIDQFVGSQELVCDDDDDSDETSQADQQLRALCNEPSKPSNKIIGFETLN